MCTPSPGPWTRRRALGLIYTSWPPVQCVDGGEGGLALSIRFHMGLNSRCAFPGCVCKGSYEVIPSLYVRKEIRPGAMVKSTLGAKLCDYLQWFLIISNIPTIVVCVFFWWCRVESLCLSICLAVKEHISVCLFQVVLTFWTLSWTLNFITEHRTNVARRASMCLFLWTQPLSLLDL